MFNVQEKMNLIWSLPFFITASFFRNLEVLNSAIRSVKNLLEFKTGLDHT